MRKYLATLPNKSDKEKKRFAVLASSSLTLTIFAVWILVNFGLPESVTVADLPKEEQEVVAVSPFENIGEGVANAWQSIKDRFEMGLTESFKTLETVDIESTYQELKDEALTDYGEQ